MNQDKPKKIFTLWLGFALGMVVGKWASEQDSFTQIAKHGVYYPLFSKVNFKCKRIR
jgi:hypothetical protein